MSEKFMRHFVSFMGMLVCFLAFFAGYKAGQFDLWWAGAGVIVIYIILFGLLEV